MAEHKPPVSIEAEEIVTRFVSAASACTAAAAAVLSLYRLLGFIPIALASATIPPAIPPMLTCLAAGLAWLLARSGRITPAYRVLMLALLLFALWPVMFIGIYAQSLTIFPVLILTAGFARGAREAAAVTALAIGMLLLIYGAGRFGLLANPTYHAMQAWVHPEERLITLGIVVALTGWVTSSYATFVNESRRALIELNAALAERSRQAEAASAAKSRFLATMSHEIRTPLNGVLGMAQLLLTPGLSDEDRADYAQTILGSGRILLNVLNDVLDMSKIEAGKMELLSRRFDCRRLLEETVSLFSANARTKGLALRSEFTGPERAEYLGDDLRLQQMLSNLVGNSLKFTATGSVAIQIRELSRSPAAAVLEFAVTDTGIGVSAQDRERLFRRFSQVDDSSTRRVGGAGLGLSIVHALAEMMSGTVGVESEPGKGSRFWFRVEVGLPGP